MREIQRLYFVSFMCLVSLYQFGSHGVRLFRELVTRATELVWFIRERGGRLEASTACSYFVEKLLFLSCAVV